MTRFAAVALVLALAGCTVLEPPPPVDDAEEEIEHPDSLEGSGPLCGRVAIEAPGRVRVGDPIEVVASLANCGNRTLQIDRGLCPDEGSGFRLLVRRSVNDWHLHAREAYEAAALHDTPCVRGGSSVFGLPPAREDVVIAHVVAFQWNGTFATDPCWPPPAPGAVACLQFAPLVPGEYLLRARIGASGVFWESEQALTVEGDTPATSAPCAALDVRREEGAFVVEVDACGTSDLTLDAGLACSEGYPVRLRIERDGRSWRVGNGTASAQAGCAPEPAERVVPAGGHAWARIAWDARLDGEPAPPGDYEVVAEIHAREGAMAEARGAFTVA